MADQYNQATQSQPTKSEKGRLKKLWKKCQSIDPTKERSGIVHSADWNLLKELEHRHLTGPGLSWRKNHPRNSVEGSDHRDVLFQFLSNTNKRKHEDDESTGTNVSPLPSWSSVHNGAAVQRCAVLEVHLESAQQLEAVRHVIEKSVTNRHVFIANTRWFVNPHHPKSIAQAVMYATPTSKSSSLKQQQQDIKSMADLYQSMLSLLLKPEELEQEGYPQASVSEPQSSTTPDVPTTQPPVTATTATALEHGFLPPFLLATRRRTQGSTPTIWGLDCEMVQTRVGLELARLTLLKMTAIEKHTPTTKMVLDIMVRPKHAVTDYLTPYSGINAELLEQDDVLELEQVQAKLLELVCEQDIFVGHSLENDFKAMRWIHQNVVDTSVLFRPTGARFKFSLRHLTKTLLRRDIQQASHCSHEDALAALELAVRRAVLGLAFGINTKAAPCNRLVEYSRHGTVVCVGPCDWLQTHITTSSSSIHALSCESVDDPNSKAIAAWLSDKATRPAQIAWGHWKVGDRHIEGFLELLNDVLAKTKSTGTMVAVFLQAGYESTSKLTDLRKVRMNPKTTIGWTDEEQEEWMTAVETCRKGLAVWIGGPADVDKSN